MIKIEDKSKCCGCSACYNICPQKCITMQEDNEGFLYPVIDESKCINCNLCEKVCPIINKKKEEKFQQKAYLVNNINLEVRKESTSGGAFTAIAEYVIENNGVVFGAAFNENFEVIHKYVENTEELRIFRNSKYVQSNLKNCFTEVKQFLKDNKLVCFSGTPCQIEGLKSFLGKEYDNLITVDIVCHAVPSPLVWRKYLEYIKEKFKSKKIKKILFRDKSKYGYKYSTMTIQSDKDIYQKGVETDPYLRAFFSDLSDRPSCYDCKFKKQYRVSDFTIWDCFGVENFDKSLDDDKGTTRVLIHTENANKIFEKIKGKFKVCEVEPEKLVENVKEMYHSVSENPKRKEFFNDINEIETRKFFKKYFTNSIKVLIERNIRVLFAKVGGYKKIKKIAKKILNK